MKTVANWLQTLGTVYCVKGLVETPVWWGWVAAGAALILWGVLLPILDARYGVTDNQD